MARLTPRFHVLRALLNSSPFPYARHHRPAERVPAEQRDAVGALVDLSELASEHLSGHTVDLTADSDKPAEKAVAAAAAASTPSPDTRLCPPVARRVTNLRGSAVAVAAARRCGLPSCSPPRAVAASFPFSPQARSLPPHAAETRDTRRISLTKRHKHRLLRLDSPVVVETAPWSIIVAMSQAGASRRRPCRRSGSTSSLLHQ